MSKSRGVQAGPMLNAYPDSLGGTLGDIAGLLAKPDFQSVFQSFYILPSVFNTDLDRGFSLIDYELNELLASRDDLKQLKNLGIEFKFDLILNHASVLSRQFQDLIKNGDQSPYRDFFIDWNQFWQGCGEMAAQGYIQPRAELIRAMFFRKPGLPVLMIRFPDGREVPYWNTFYQEVRYREVDPQDLTAIAPVQYGTASWLADRINKGLRAGQKPAEIDFGRFSDYRQPIIDFIEINRRYLGQMDLNIKSPLVWQYYQDTLRQLAGYGAEIVRLDAFAYASKEPGARNFLNAPGTWDLLERVRQLAEPMGITLLPEIHAPYEEKIHEKLALRGYMTYDFFLPGLIIDALERQTAEVLVRWANELQDKQIRTVNMLGCHDGIPLLDLKGLLQDEQIGRLIQTVVARGGYVKDLHGQKNVYYQVNATYFSALGEDERKLLLARAIQMFMPGRPQIWYLDLLAGKNDHAAVDRAGPGGHKEINRTNLTLSEADERLKLKVVQEQLALIRLRNTCRAFGFDARMTIALPEPHLMTITWENKGCRAEIKANLRDCSFDICSG